MKRRYVLLIMLVAMASLAVPASAGPPTLFEHEYEGRAERDPDTYLGFDVVRANGGKKVAKFSAFLKYHCAGDSGGNAYARARGRLGIANRRFAGTLEADQFPTRAAMGAPDRIRYRVRGKFRRGGVARGRIDAELFLNDGTRCYSGELDWRARRGAETGPSG